MKIMNRFFLISTLFVATSLLQAQSISEKKAILKGGGNSSNDLTQDMQKFLVHVNQELKDWHSELQQLYGEVFVLYNQNASEYSYKELLNKINGIRENIYNLENSWRQMASQTGREDGYGLWHQPETTLGQLVMDYGSQNYVYLMTPEIAAMKLSVNSNLPIPRGSWNEMIEAILTQNGIGIKQVNPYLRQLFLIKEDNSNIKLITNKRQDLEPFPPETRVTFVLSPEPSDVRRIYFFLEKFINPNSTVLQLVGRDILVIGAVAEIQDILKLYDFASSNRGDKEYKAVPIFRVDAEEMAKILGAIFDQLSPEATHSLKPMGEKGRPSDSGNSAKKNTFQDNGGGNGLKVIALANVAQAIFLVGTKEEIHRAEGIIREVENQVGEATEKVVYLYTAKHSDADELGAILSKVYDLMIASNAGLERDNDNNNNPNNNNNNNNNPQYNLPKFPPGSEAYIRQTPPPMGLYDEGYYLDDRFIVNPTPGQNDNQSREFNKNRNNFIVDPKTSSIVMVVEVDALNKLKEVIKKLDVPKKMVQIEVLLFEKVIEKSDNFGLNLLKIGNCASDTHSTCYDWNDIILNSANLGVFQFLLSRKKSSGIPAYDLAYKFLLTQDDVTINASPSVVAVNQTKAIIDIDTEISVSTGVFIIPVEGSNTEKDAFARARYGTKIEITPTIHMADESECGEDSPNYITMDTNILFETVHRNAANPNRPPVTRRKINNQVRVEDGHTIILGGLRSKTTEDDGTYIPFLGDIPGFGKLFSTTSLLDHSTEMFIFITPRIISDPGPDMERIKRLEMTRRVGDIPEFLCLLEKAREEERDRAYRHSLTILFGPEPERCYSPYGEYALPEDYNRECREYDGR
jgi:general secretion pathway protein D